MCVGVSHVCVGACMWMCAYVCIYVYASVYTCVWWHSPNVNLPYLFMCFHGDWYLKVVPSHIPVTNLISQLSFSETSCHIKFKEFSLPYYLPIAGVGIVKFIPFPRVNYFVKCKQPSQIFIIKGFRTIVFIFIVIYTTFQPICPPAFFRCLLNLGTYTELWTTSFVESTGCHLFWFH